MWRARWGLMGCVLGLCVGALDARAHGPAPSPLEVLNIAGQTPGGLTPAAGDPNAYADVIRTSIGLVFSLPDATYRFGCPSAWGDTTNILAAATPDRALVSVVALGAAFASTDGGCTFEPLSTDGFYVANTYYALGRVWLLARTLSAASELGPGVLLEVLPDATLREHHRWSDGFVPDDLGAWTSEDGASSGLLVVGARPAMALWLATASDSTFSWASLASLPSVDLSALSRLNLRAVEPTGALWLQATLGAERHLWLAVPQGGGLGPGVSFRWFTQTHPPADVIAGPVLAEERWWAVIDGRLSSFPKAAQILPEDAPLWVSGPEVDWTCLRQRQDAVHACALFRLLHVTAMGDAVTPPTANIVFTFDNLGPPLRGCAVTESVQCDSDWLHYGGESGFVGRDPIDLYGDPVALPIPEDTASSTDTGLLADTENPADTAQADDPNTAVEPLPTQPDDCACVKARAPSRAPVRSVVWVGLCVWVLVRGRARRKPKSPSKTPAPDAGKLVKRSA